MSRGARRRAVWRVAAAGATALAAARLGGGAPDWAAGAALGWTLAALCQHDLRRRRLPDAFTLPLIAGGVALAGAAPDGAGPALTAAATAAAAYGVCWALSTLWWRLRGVDGLGLGDAKLIAAAGAWLGPARLPDALLIACGLGALWAAGSAVRHGFDRDRAIPFGPAIALGFAITWLAMVERGF